MRGLLLGMAGSMGVASLVLIAGGVGCRTSPEASGPAGALEAPQLDPTAAEICRPMLTHDFAFTSSASGNSEIYLYVASNRTVRRLTTHTAQDHWATWSPDGSTIAFQTLRDGNREIYTQAIDGSSLRNITDHPEQDLLPAWSPDGGTIAFFSSRILQWDGSGPLGGHIFASDPDGTDPRVLPLPPFVSTPGIGWSSDGARIAYARYREGENGIYTFDLASGTETRVLTGDAPGSVGGASFSTTTAEIAFYRSREDGADVYIVPAEGGTARRVTPGTGYHYDAAWSPDGTALMVTSSTDGTTFDLRCIAVDGSYDVPVTVGAEARTAAWRPGK